MNLLKSIKQKSIQVGNLLFFGENGKTTDANGNLWYRLMHGFNSYFSFGDGGRLTANIDQKSYAENPYFFMVVDRIAEIAASLPREFIDERTGKEYTNTRNERYNNLRRIFESPNNFQDQYDFYYTIVTNLLKGELFIYKEGEGIGQTLYAPIPYNVTINENLQGISPKSYSFTYFNKAFNNVDTQNILHLKRVNTLVDSHYGLATAVPTTSLWSISNQLFKNAWNLFRNSGIMGVLHGKGNSSVMTPKERGALQQQYNREAGNSEHLGKVYVTGTEMGFLSMGMNPTDLKSVEQNLQLKRDICAAFNVASQLFGDTDASTYSNMEQAERAMYINAILPICNRIDKALNNWLNPNDNIKYKVNESQIPILQDAKTEQITNAINLYKDRLLTLEEARRRLGEDYESVPAELLQNQNEQNNVTNENSNSQNNQQNE